MTRPTIVDEGGAADADPGGPRRPAAGRATPAAARRSYRDQMGRSSCHACLAALGAGLLVACTAAEEEVRPPEDRVFFPTGLAVAPDEAHLFVISANSELRYDSGTVTVVDLAQVDEVVGPWLADGTIPQGCERDPLFAETLACGDSTWTRFLVPGASVRIGNFATTLAVQDKGGGDLRLVIPVRGDPSVTWIDWRAAEGTLDCADAEGFPLCDDSHRLTRFLDDPELPSISDEPFGVTVDSAGEFALITHLASATVSLVDLPAEGDPILTDVLTGLFNADASGRRGAAAAASRTPGEPGNIVYVTSRSENRVQTFTVGRSAVGGLAELVPGAYFFLDRVGSSAGGGSSDTREVAFGMGGDLGYFMNRRPPSLALVDTSLGETGVPRNDVIGATDLCREAADLAVADTGDGERAYVTCFQDGELYVVDPRAGVFVEAITSVGRGPFGVAVAPGRQRLYVTNFFENSIAVVDLVPNSPTQYRVVLRIGTPP